MNSELPAAPPAASPPSPQLKPDALRPVEKLEAVAGLPLVIASAPDHIWLDLGELAHLIGPDTRCSDLADVTWSEDNATGHGIRYVRADVAASPAAPAPCAMVGLTECEQRQIWIEVQGTANGYGPVMDAAVRAFCQKNKLPEPKP